MRKYKEVNDIHLEKSEDKLSFSSTGYDYMLRKLGMKNTCEKIIMA